MIDKLQLTIYEFFGYLLPGSVAVLAICTLYWALCLPLLPLPIYKLEPSVSGWSALALASYLTGHLLQGIGNKFFRGTEIRALRGQTFVSATVVTRARDLVANQVGIRPQDIDDVSLFRLADAIAIQRGATTDRDLFVYREGFYKGCAIAFVLLAIALLTRALKDATAIEFPGYVYYVSTIQLCFAAVVAAVASAISRQRFFRFSGYRVSRALHVLLAASKEN